MAESRPRPCWEYRVERYSPDDAPSHGEHRAKFEATLNEMGADGWEPVVVVPLLPYELVLRRPMVEDCPLSS